MTVSTDIPMSQEVVVVVDDFRERMRAQETEPSSLDDEFIGGLTYREYFALSDAEAEALWNELGADAPRLEDLPEIEVTPDTRLPARQWDYPAEQGQALRELRAAYLTMSEQDRQGEIALAEEGLRGQLSLDEASPAEEEYPWWE